MAIASILSFLLGVLGALLLFVWLVMMRAPKRPEAQITPVTTSSGEKMVFACPYCGQGGLAAADILATPRVGAVVCQECDRVWLSPKLVGFDADGCVEDVLPNLGMPPDWSHIVWEDCGVPWSRIALAYQEIIARELRESGTQNE